MITSLALFILCFRGDRSSASSVFPLFAAQIYLQKHIKRSQTEEYVRLLRSGSIRSETFTSSTWSDTPSRREVACPSSKLSGSHPKRSHRCTQCGKSFIWAEDLKWHRHTHTHTRGRGPSAAPSVGRASLSSLTSQSTSAATREKDLISAHAAPRASSQTLTPAGTSAPTQERDHTGREAGCGNETISLFIFICLVIYSWSVFVMFVL